MKKTLYLLATLFLLNGCVESLALLGTATSVSSGGNIAHSAISSAASYGVKKQTGMTPSQHALAYVKEHNPENKKESCIGIKSTNSQACTIANKKVAFAKSKVKQAVNEKKISFKKIFAEARKEGKKSFIFNNKIYNTSFKKNKSKKSVFFNR